MCTYNGEAYVEGQIESILDQTVEPDEIVICDDASDDGTVSTLRQYEREYPDIIEVHENARNRGVTQNFERCIHRCSGDAIAISDQDDIWKPEKLATEVEVLKQTGVSLVFHNVTLATESLESVGDLWSWNGYSPGLARDRKRALRELVHGNFVQGASALFDANFLATALPIPAVCQYDHYLAVVAAVTGGLYDVDEELLLYRQHSDQDIGADPNRTVIDRLLGSWQLDRHEWHATHATKWKAISNRLREIAQANQETPPAQFVQFVENKYRYEREEATIYDSDEPIPERMAVIADHWNQGWYARYGPLGRATALKDAVGALLTGLGE